LIPCCGTIIFAKAGINLQIEATGYTPACIFAPGYKKTMAGIIRVSITINATPQEVWEYLMDPGNLKNWLTGFVSIRHVSGTAVKTGSISHIKFLERGKETEVTETVLSSEPYQQYSILMEHETFSAETDMRLLPFGNRTELIQTVQFQPRVLLMKLLMPFMKGLMKKRTLSS
jgi:carbon monoxide dehydrogenase subunit G